MTQPPLYFAMRLVRHGPVVPARVWPCTHEPGEPSNPRDRWPAIIWEADIAGERVPPEQLTERLFWTPPHWKSLQPISEQEYRLMFERMRQAEHADPSNPVLSPRKRVDPAAVALPSFAEENER